MERGNWIRGDGGWGKMNEMEEWKLLIHVGRNGK